MGNLCSDSGESGDGPVVFERQLSVNKRGRYTWSCVWGYRPACMAALRRAEMKHGRPVYVVEIAQEWRSIIPYMVAPMLLTGLNELYRNDEVLADLHHNQFTLNPAH